MSGHVRSPSPLAQCSCVRMIGSNQFMYMTVHSGMVVLGDWEISCPIGHSQPKNLGSWPAVRKGPSVRLDEHPRFTHHRNHHVSEESTYLHTWHQHITICVDFSEMVCEHQASLYFEPGGQLPLVFAGTAILIALRRASFWGSHGRHGRPTIDTLKAS